MFLKNMLCIYYLYFILFIFQFALYNFIIVAFVYYSHIINIKFVSIIKILEQAIKCFCILCLG